MPKEGEELSSYKTRFKYLSDITFAHLGGEIILHWLIGNGADIYQKARKEAWEKNDGISIPGVSYHGAIRITVF